MELAAERFMASMLAQAGVFAFGRQSKMSPVRVPEVIPGRAWVRLSG